QRLEEQLDLPAVLVDRGDRRGAEGEMIRQEDQGAVLVGIVDLDAAQPERTFRRRVPTRQLDDLVAQDGAALRDRAPLDHLYSVWIAYQALDTGFSPCPPPAQRQALLDGFSAARFEPLLRKWL